MGMNELGWVGFHGWSMYLCKVGMSRAKVSRAGRRVRHGEGGVSCFFLSVRVTFWKGVGRGRREQKAGQGCRSCGKTSVG